MRAKPKTPRCPICGREMRKTGWGAAAKQHGQQWICPVAEAEVYMDRRGHLHRTPDAKHLDTRVWNEDDLLPPNA